MVNNGITQYDLKPGVSYIAPYFSSTAGAAIPILSGDCTTLKDVWQDKTDPNNPITYSYNTTTRNLTISGGNNSVLAGDSLILNHFDVNAAQSPDGYEGICLKKNIAISAGSCNPSNSIFDQLTNQTVAEQQGAIQVFNVVVSEVRDVAQTVVLKADSAIASFLKIIKGDDTVTFEADGTVQITIPAGQDSVTLTLLDTSGNSTADDVQLTASQTDSSGNVTTSNNLAITFDSPNPDAGTSSTSGTADRTITGLFKPKEMQTTLAVGAAIDPTWRILSTAVGQTEPGPNNTTVIVSYVYQYNQVDDLGNLIPDTSQPDPNQNYALNGSSLNDLIQLGNGNNSVNATQGGNDTITGGNGKNGISAGNGNNTITVGNGGNSITVGDGSNVITTGSGNDYIRTGNGTSTTINVISGGGGQDIILAGIGSNQIYAGTQTDLATALSQQKTTAVINQKGDFIAVGDGSNTIVGGSGNDAIFTGTGNNTIVCGPGAVTIEGGVETGLVSANWTVTDCFSNTPSNSTTFSLVNAASAPFTAPASYYGNYWLNNPLGLGNDTIFGGTGNSVYWLSNGNNWLDAGGGKDHIFAGIGNNTIFGGVGNDTIWGAGGGNFISLESGSDYVVLEGGNSTVIGGSGNDTIYSGDSGVNGVDWADSQTTANNYIDGGSGNSQIFGSGGNDTLIGGTGNVTISGGNGNEYIVAGDGNASINGGNGNETIYGGIGNDTIWAGDGNTTIYGGDGSDVIVGGAGTDVISAGDGGTTSAPTYVYAGSGTTSIYGGVGVDYLFGSTSGGSDTLVAGTGILKRYLVSRADSNERVSP